MVLAAVVGCIDRGALGCQGDVGEAELLCPPQPRQEPHKRLVVGGAAPGG